MNYLTAKLLKDSGFPQREIDYDERLPSIGEYRAVQLENGFYDSAYAPSLSELITACEVFTNGTSGSINIHIYPHAKGKGWGEEPADERRVVYALTSGRENRGEGNTPELAVANLWLELHKK